MVIKKKKSNDDTKWYKKLKNRYRLVIMNDETYEERLSFRLSRLNVFVFLGTLSIFLIVLTTLIIALTPLREYIPGYMDTRIPKLVYNLQRKTDSLEIMMDQKTRYLNTIRQVISGDEFTDTLLAESFDSGLVNYDTLELRNSHKDSLFRAEFEKNNQFNIYLYENQTIGDEQSLMSPAFFTPLEGAITNNFNLAENHYGIDIVCNKNETIKATLDGTVIFSDWTLETGYVIGILHQGNYMSIYKHNSSLLKRTGNYVKAGEPIAIVGETGELSTGPHLHFELWYNGTPVNPLEYIAF
jgi:murein DD-endopeptidase MepM/ murein hydrolase activator NlpD